MFYKREDKSTGLEGLAKTIQQNLNHCLYTDAIDLRAGKDHTLITLAEAEKIKLELSKNETRIYFTSKRGNECILYPQNCKTICFRKCKVDSDNEEID